MISYFAPSKSIGLLVSEDTLKYALISKNKHKIEILKTETIDLDCKTALHTFQDLCRKVPVAVALDSSMGQAGKEEINIKNTKDLENVLKNKVESSLVGQKIILRVLKKGPGSASYFALKEQAYEASLSFEGDAHYPHILAPLALNNANSIERSIFFNDFGCDIYLGGEEVLSFSSASEDYEKKILLALYQHFNEDNESPIYYFGTSKTREQTLEYLRAQTPLQFEETNLPHCSETPDYAVQIGLALLLIEDSFPSFTPKARSLSSLYKQEKANLLFSLGLVLLIGLTQLSIWGFKARHGRIQNQKLYTGILCHPFLERKAKLPQNYTPEQSVSQVKQLLIKSRGKHLPYSLNPTSPTVRETLAWVKTLYESLREGNESPFVLDRFEYKLVGAPTMKAYKAPYLVKVKLAFRASSPEMARSIHRKLLGSSEFIQTDKKITWTYQNNLYETTFFLKKVLEGA